MSIREMTIRVAANSNHHVSIAGNFCSVHDIASVDPVDPDGLLAGVFGLFSNDQRVVARAPMLMGSKLTVDGQYNAIEFENPSSFDVTIKLMLGAGRFEIPSGGAVEILGGSVAVDNDEGNPLLVAPRRTFESFIRNQYPVQETTLCHLTPREVSECWGTVYVVQGSITPPMELPSSNIASFRQANLAPAASYKAGSWVTIQKSDGFVRPAIFALEANTQINAVMGVRD